MSRYSDETPEYREGVKRRVAEGRRRQPEHYLWMKAKRRAKKAGLPFDIEPSDIRIPSHCPALGIPIEILSKHPDYSATLDRIINERGYVKGNVAVISRRANRIKNSATVQELTRITRWLIVQTPSP